MYNYFRIEKNYKGVISLDSDKKKQHEEFLRDFTYAGEYYCYDDNTLEFKESHELIVRREKSKRKISGYYAICVDSEIKYIGESKVDVDNKFTSSYKTGGSKSKKSQDNSTYKIINKNIKKMICENKHVATYFIECEVNKANDHRERFNDIFDKYPDWDRKNSKRTFKEVFKQFTEADKQTFREAIEEDRKEEVNQQRKITDTSLKPKRNPQERIKALEQSGDKCALDGFKGQACVTFVRRNITPGISEKYLEAHHLIPFYIDSKKKELNLKGNLDVAENMVCLCSNCHNKIHYGKYEEVFPMLEALYKQRIKDLKSKNLNISKENLLDLYKLQFALEDDLADIK